MTSTQEPKLIAYIWRYDPETTDPYDNILIGAIYKTPNDQFSVEYFLEDEDDELGDSLFFGGVTIESALAEFKEYYNGQFYIEYLNT